MGCTQSQRWGEGMLRAQGAGWSGGRVVRGQYSPLQTCCPLASVGCRTLGEGRRNQQQWGPHQPLQAPMPRALPFLLRQGCPSCPHPRDTLPASLLPAGGWVDWRTPGTFPKAWALII